ncbi:PEP-CTERM sorting domain-containing protein [Isosphaeraceae bacterium EP7]
MGLTQLDPAATIAAIPSACIFDTVVGSMQGAHGCDLMLSSRMLPTTALVLALLGSIAPATPASASTLVTFWDQRHIFSENSYQLSADPSFGGTAIKGERGIAGVFGPRYTSDGMSDGTLWHATDSNSFAIIANFIVPSDTQNDTGRRVWVTLEGSYTGDLTGGDRFGRMSGSYTGQVNSIHLGGSTLDGERVSLDITDPSKPIDYTAVSRSIEGTDVPLALIDGFLHLNRYSISGYIGGGHYDVRLLTLNIAGGPAPEPVPEPATLLTFAALLGGLAYRQFRSNASPVPAV